MIKAYFDGACDPNPYGDMGIGAIILKDDQEIFKYSEVIPASKKNSSSVAEYLALEKILIYIRDTTIIEEQIFIYGDSKMVINQMHGDWNIIDGMYVPAATRCLDLGIEIVNEIKKILLLTWIPRELNQVADGLSKEKLIKSDIPFPFGGYRPISKFERRENKDWLEISKKIKK